MIRYSCRINFIHSSDLPNSPKICFLIITAFGKLLWLDCILTGCCTLKPNCYNLLLHRHDRRQTFIHESSALFGEVLSLYCILPNGCKLKPSCYFGKSHTKNLFAKRQCFFSSFHLLVYSDIYNFIFSLPTNSKG